MVGPADGIFLLSVARGVHHAGAAGGTRIPRRHRGRRCRTAFAAAHAVPVVDRGAAIAMIADASTRAERRLADVDKTSSDYRTRYSEVLRSIQERDARDKQNTILPPEDTSLYLDNTNVSIKECAVMAVLYIEKQLAERTQNLANHSMPNLRRELGNHLN